MKKIARLITALALMTYAFTSCEDIPAPFNTNGPQNDVIKVDPVGEGTKANPFNVSGIIDYTKELANGASTAEVYVTGYVVNIREYQQQYNSLNYDIADDVEGKSEYFYVYGGKGLNKATFNSMADLPIGSKVTICGKVKNHNGVLEFDSQNYIVELDGKTSGGDDPSAEAKGTGTLEDPFNAVAATIEAQKLESGAVSEKAYYIKGKVSKIATDKNGNILNFDQGTYGNASFYISDDGEAKNDFYCYRILYLGNKKWTSGAGDILKVGDDVIVCAKLTMYNSTPETQQNEGYLYSLNGKTEGSEQGGGDTPTPTDDAQAVTIAQFNAAAESTEVWYKLTGTVKNLKDGDLYGNFDLEDETGTVYVYGLLSEKGGEKKKFQELVAAKDIKEGSKITIIGNRGSYTNKTTGEVKIEVMNAYFVSIEDGSSSGGDNTGTGADGSTIISVADFNAAAESTDVWYQLTGTIKNLKDGDLYGNFDLEDSTGSVYVYGVLSEKGGEKKKFQDLVTAKGIANGKTITIVGNRGSYTNKNTGETKIEVLNAYFIKVE